MRDGLQGGDGFAVWRVGCTKSGSQSGINRDTGISWLVDFTGC